MSKIPRIFMTATLSILALVSIAAAVAWETDFEKAKETARTSNRYILINFTGSDWCGWCIKLEEDVFGQSVFGQYAKENLVPVFIDFPRKTHLEETLKEQNEALAGQYGISGFPTILILSPDGEIVAQTGYQRGGAEKYVDHLKGFIDSHRQKNQIPEPTTPPAVKAPRARRGVPASVLREWQNK